MENDATKEIEKIKAEYENQLKIDSEYKEKFGAIAKAESEDEGKTIVIYFKAPHRMALGSALAILERDVLQGCEIIFDSCVIAEISPDWEKFRNDNGRFIGLVPLLQSLCVVKKSTYKML